MKKLHIAALAAGLSAGLMTAPVASAQQRTAGMSTQDYYTRIQGLRRQANGVVVFAEPPWILAKVKNINAAGGQMTISHGPIPQIKMPAMTMTFPVRSPADITGHKVGDVVQVQIGKDADVIKIVHVRAKTE